MFTCGRAPNHIADARAVLPCSHIDFLRAHRFPGIFFDDYTDRMQPYIDKWKALDLHFNGILTGFLGSDRQIDIVENFIKDFKDDNTLVIIDPVIGDNGRPYPTYTASMCEKMRSLVKHADILTPNLTEACILTSTDYRPDMSLKNICDIAIKLTETGAGKVVITGLDRKSMIANVICEKGHEPKIIRQKRCGHERSGTGDVFASIIAASAVLGYDLSFPSERLHISYATVSRLPRPWISRRQTAYVLKKFYTHLNRKEVLP